MIDLEGTVKLDGNADETVVSFSGSGIVGDLLVNAANGTLTLATNKATFVGVLDVAQGKDHLRYNGTIVRVGTTAYTAFLTLEVATLSVRSTYGSPLDLSFNGSVLASPDQVTLTGSCAVFLMKPLLAATMPGVVGCPNN